MRYTYRAGISKLRNNLSYGLSTLVLVGMSLGGALPAFITSTAHAATPIDIYNVAQLRDAIEHQSDNEVWNIHAGNYGLSAFNDITAGCPTSCQTGWYFPVTASNLTINGIGNPTIYGTGYSTNGTWATQNFVSVFGNNVTITGLTLMPKVEPNKTIEVLGDDFTLTNTVITPNTLTDSSEYNSIPNAQDSSDERQWGGSLYFSHAGNHTIQNVTINNAGVSFRYSPTGTHITFSGVKIVDTSNVDWINGYRFSSGFNAAGNTTTGLPGVEYHVNSTLDNLNDVLANVQNGDTIKLDSDLVTSRQATLTKSVTLDGQGYTISPNFAKTDNSNNAAVGVLASNVTINNLVEDGTHGTDLHGVNVYQASGVNLDGVTLNNNGHNGLVVNGSNVTVDNLSTSNNGWGGVDVDKTGAVLTVNGTSHHNEVSPDIYVDNTSVGTVVDTNHQYGSVDNVKQAGDRVYRLNLGIPTVVYPGNNSYINTNDFWFKWSTVAGASSYEFQASQSPSTDANGALNSNAWTGDYQHNQPATSTLHSVGANGTWYWQVRTVDAYGIKGAWSPVWKVTIDMVAPTAPTNLSWKDSNNHTKVSGSFTNVQKGTLSWQDTSTDVNKYVYKFWTNIPGYFNGESNAWTTDSSQYITMTPSGGSIWTDFANKEGAYNFCVEAVDAAGNTSPCSATFTVTYDKTAPVVSITAPKDGDFVRGTVTLSCTVTDVNPDHYYLVVKDSKGKVVTGPGIVYQATVSNWNWDTTKVADGVYTIDLEARDKAGNKDANSTATIKVTVDNTAPVITDTSFDIAMLTGDKHTLKPTVTDNSTVSYQWSINESKLQLLNDPDPNAPLNTSTLTIGPAPKGTYSVTLVATDQAGNQSLPKTYTITVSTPGNPTSNTVGRGASTPQNQAVLGDTTTNNNSQDNTPPATTTPEVKGDTTDKPNVTSFASDNATNKNAKTAANFLGLGWWWLAILAVLLGGLFAVLFRRSDSNAKN